MWIAFIVFLMLFQMAFMSLSGINKSDCLYGFLLEGFIFLILASIGFTRYHIRFHKIKKALLSDADEQSKLPETSDCLEELYQEIIENQIISRRNIKAEKDRINSDMMQYYGMWVHQIKTPIAAMHLLLQRDLSDLLQNKGYIGKSEKISGENNAEDDNFEEYYLKADELKKELSYELFQIEQYTEMALQYQRVQSDTNDFVLDRVSLDKVIRDSIRKYAKILIRKKLSIQYPGTDISVISDEKWLCFILEQVLSNAVKYTKKGKITINVFANKNKVICVEIVDEGIGISAEDLPRVFEKGYTGYNGHENKTSTGIGLYLCKQAAEKLGHRLEIDSEEGKGTKVRLYLTKM